MANIANVTVCASILQRYNEAVANFPQAQKEYRQKLVE